jgi:putative cell wall-binding protein
MTYIERFAVTVGFSVEEAKSAKYVTIVGGAGGVPTSAEQTLRNAGCKVERIAGITETETRQMLEKLAAEGKRFKLLQ